MAPDPAVEAIGRELARQGLVSRGCFDFAAGESAPPGPDGAPARAVLLAGQAGPAMWERFRAERRDEPDPLDAWTRRVLDRLARRFAARTVLASDGPPYPPFQAWAARAEPVRPSPIGLSIHPRWGLRHSWRGALLFARPLGAPPPAPAPRPCETCAGRPCLSACPVGAFDGGRYDAEACRARLRAPEGRDCLDGGCLARRACPVGAHSGHGAEQAGFHMRAFLGGASAGSGR